MATNEHTRLGNASDLADEALTINKETLSDLAPEGGDSVKAGMLPETKGCPKLPVSLQIGCNVY